MSPYKILAIPAGLAPAIFGPLMNASGSFLASWWRKHIPKDQK